MKTKISHLGRSSVSVILAVMMLLSTMLIGTVSTVNAVTKKFNSVNLVGDINGNYNWDSAEYPFTFDETTGNWYLDITITQSSEFKARVDGKWDTSFGASGGNYTISEIGDYRISVKDGAENGTDLKVEKTVKKVADSVTLTANPTSVKVGNSVTLTPTVSSAKSDNLTYTYKKTSGGTATEVKNADNSLTVTPTVAGTYKYTVTVSADGYSPVTSIEASFTVTDSVKYYIGGRFKGESWNPNRTDMQFVKVDGESNLYKYETNMTVSQLSQNVDNAKQYFFIHTGNGNEKVYYASSDGLGHTFHKNSINNQLTLKYYSTKADDEKNYIKFDDVADSSSNVVLYLDTSDKDNLKLYYSTEKYSVTVAEGVPASVDKTEFAKDEKVTVTATPGTGKVLNTVTVVGEDGSTQIETTVSGNTATFKMPAQNVTVKEVTFREAKKYTITFRSSDETFGTVSAKRNGTNPLTSDTKVTEGDEVTFTATQNPGYTFTGWTVNDASVSPTTNPYTITVQKDTTVVANFKEVTGTLSKYYLLCGTGATFKADSYTHVPLYTNEDGVFYADFDVAKDSIPKSKDYFIIFSTKKDTSGIIVDSNNVTVNAVNKNGFSLSDYNENVQNPSGGTNNVKFAKVYIDKDDVTGFTIKITNLDLTNKKITYSAEPTFDVAPANTVEITAKDGTIRAGYTDTDASKTTAVLGDTTLSITTPDDKIITASDSYMIEEKNRAVTAKRVPNGSTVTVTTTIDPTATFAGHKGSDYYVKGFSVNGVFGGVLSQTDGKNHSGDVYTYTFEVNQEIYGSKLEITPVYFLKDDANCVYFYIENYDSAKQIWGNTPSCYVYYGSGTTTLEALGYYPGQPMVDYNGSIFTQIPKSIVNGDTKEKITGMTLNNYVWDDVHRDYNGKDQKSDNAQTYDYDDFVKIAESGVNVDNIIYRFKYNEFNNEPADTFAASKADAAGWEVFLDYQNYPTDIFGNKIGTEKLDYKDTKSVTSKDNYLSIISDGYQNNYIGKYATAWSIYNKAGDRVATIPSSALLYALGKTDEQMTTAIDSASTPPDFLPGKTDRDTYWKTFKTLYQNYKDVYAQINFDAAIKGGDDYGNRLDGRWYYSQSKQKITGEIKLQYANTLDDYKVGGFQEDTFENASSIVGTTTGASAYFTDPENRVRKLETFADNTQDYKFEVTATSTAAYTFVGWYRLIDGDYKAINPSNMSS